jgi:hypothetical protein
VGTSFEDYLAAMRQPGCWGDNVTLQAVADRLNVEVAIVTSFEERADGDAVLLVAPRQRDARKVAPPITRTLWLYARARSTEGARAAHVRRPCAQRPRAHRLQSSPRVTHGRLASSRASRSARSLSLSYPECAFACDRSRPAMPGCRSFYAEVHYQSIEPNG